MHRSSPVDLGRICPASVLSVLERTWHRVLKMSTWIKIKRTNFCLVGKSSHSLDISCDLLCRLKLEWRQSCSCRHSYFGWILDWMSEHRICTTNSQFPISNHWSLKTKAMLGTSMVVSPCNPTEIIALSAGNPCGSYEVVFIIRSKSLMSTLPCSTSLMLILINVAHRQKFHLVAFFWGTLTKNESSI